MTNHRKKLITFLALGSYFLFGYLIINHLNQDRSWYLNVILPYEKDVPFWPGFIFAYALDYIGMVALYFICRDYEWPALTKSLFLLTTIHFIFFIILPVKMIWRPEIPSDGFQIWALNLIYNIDSPANCFPSLHVAYPLTVALVSKRLRPIYGFIAVATAFSVVVVKQHYVLDIVGAVVTSVFVDWIANRYWNAKSNIKKTFGHAERIGCASQRLVRLGRKASRFSKET